MKLITNLLFVILFCITSINIQAKTEIPKEVPKTYDKVFIQSAIKHNVNPRLVKTICWTESRLKNIKNKRSNATGICQIMATSHKHVNVWNPKDNIDYSTKLIKDIQIKCGEHNLSCIVNNYKYGNGGYKSGRRDPSYVNKIKRNYNYIEVGF